MSAYASARESSFGGEGWFEIIENIFVWLAHEDTVLARVDTIIRITALDRVSHCSPLKVGYTVAECKCARIFAIGVCGFSGSRMRSACLLRFAKTQYVILFAMHAFGERGIFALTRKKDILAGKGALRL